jgi:hypothetical protein
MANTAATPENTPSNAQKACVVCGLGSHRSDWLKKSGEYVACDHHTQAEIDEHVAIAKKNATATASAPKPATMPLTTSTQKPQATQAPTTASVPAIGAPANTPKKNTPIPSDKGVIGSAASQPKAPTPVTPIAGAKQPAIAPNAPKPVETKANMAFTKPVDTTKNKADVEEDAAKS